MPLPDFFVIGAPKAGTTALHVALAGHPQLFLSRVKEPKHFLTDGPPPTGGRPGGRQDLPRARLAAQRLRGTVRRGTRGHPRGESTPFYLYDGAALQRIVEAVPGRR